MVKYKYTHLGNSIEPETMKWLVWWNADIERRARLKIGYSKLVETTLEVLIRNADLRAEIESLAVAYKKANMKGLMNRKTNIRRQSKVIGK